MLVQVLVFPCQQIFFAHYNMSILCLHIVNRSTDSMELVQVTYAEDVSGTLVLALQVLQLLTSSDPLTSTQTGSL